MASLIRNGLTSILNGASARTVLFANKHGTTIIRTVTSKALREIEGRPSKPKPWPYESKYYTYFHYLYDRTTSRLDENSKIIVVEGPLAAGKSKFAKELANELGMVYFPEANQDMQYINSYGFDLRSLDPQLSAHCKSFDVNDFMINPRDIRTARFQIFQHNIKYSQYIDVLAHLLSTGEGVVLDRCVYSDFVFADAMFKAGYLSKAAYKKYYEFRNSTIGELLRPHLIIYLDVPVPKTIENIKKRNLSYERNSPVITPEYLNTMETVYKQKYLKEMNTHCELLVYDWSEGGDTEIVVEDIEKINLTPNEDLQDPKFKDWDLRNEEDWAYCRHWYADRKNDLMAFTNIPCYNVPELITDAEEVETYYEVMDAAPGETYVKGMNAAQGDKGVLFKLGLKNRDTLPRSERRTY